jgi:hypothetical protein
MNYAKVKHFWSWFERNNDVYLSILSVPKKEADYWMHELHAHLRAYCSRNLWGDIFFENENGNGHLVITAYSHPMYFKKIEKLVDKAPQIEDWTIHALYPPLPVNNLIEQCYPFVEIDPFDLWFDPLQYKSTKEARNLIVYVPMSRGITDALLGAVELVVYNLLGEKSATLDIGEVEVKSIFEIQEAHKVEVVNLVHLPSFIASDTYSGFIVDSAGVITRQ